MRTMHISLILICSLAQLTSAVDQEKVDSGGCGTVYTCLAPQKCRDTVTIADSEVVDVRRTDKIYNDCDAIIRFHRYDTRKTHIFIESFQDTSKVNKIEFTQERLNAITGKMDQLNKFSCEIDATDGKMKGKSFDDVKYQTDIADKLRCKFEILKDQPHSEKYIYDDNLLFKIFAKNDQQGVTTKDITYRFDIEVNCDPTDFEYDPPKDELTKLYEKVSDRFKPENYKCDREEFTMEYLKKGKIEYEFAKKVRCNGNKFEVFDKDASEDSDVNTNSTFGPNDVLAIRCVAEAKFFCKYSPKVKDREEGPKLEVKPEGNSLKCPPEKPYFVIVGREAEHYYPDKNPEFKCIKYGTSAAWTINSETVYTKETPTVYCTHKKNCSEPISASAVEGGTLSPNAEKLQVPKCFNEGTLKTTDGKVPTNFACDYSIGVYKFTAGGGDIHINSSTKFTCEYPIATDPPAIDDATKEKLHIGLYVALGVSALVVLVTCVGSALLMKRKMKKKRKDLMAQQAYNVQWLTKDEKAILAAKEKKNPPKSGGKSKPFERIADEQKAPGKLSQSENMARMKGAKRILKERKKHNDPNKTVVSHKKRLISYTIDIKDKKKKNLKEIRLTEKKCIYKKGDSQRVAKQGRKMIKDRTSGKVQKDEN